MIGNLGKVEQRLKVYFAPPDVRFNVKSGLSPQEELVKQRVRQYWADNDIPNMKKLEGLNIDLGGFDPRRTSNKQMMEIGAILADKGIIDGDLIGALSSIDVELDSLGKEINMDKEVDAYAYFDRQLETVAQYVAEGNDIGKTAMVELKTAISVMMALQEYAKAPKNRSMVNIRA